MATIADRLAMAGLRLYPLPEWESRSAIRSLYVSVPVLQWISEDEELGQIVKGKGNRSAREHLEQLLCDFCCAKRPGAGELRRVMPTKKGIWHLCPAGSRLFGWCPAPGYLFVVSRGLVSECHGKNSVVKKRMQEVETYIKQHGFSDCVIIGDINAIVP